MRAERRIATVPNALTVLALVCGLGVLWRGGFLNDFRGAFWFFVASGVLSILDGVIAEGFDQHSRLGDERLQPLAGLALGGSSVAALVWHHYWPVWLAVVLVIIMVVFQFISFFAGAVPRLKRHQFWMHPIFTLVVTYAAGLTMLWVLVPEDRVTSLVVSVLVAAALVFWRWPRFQYWFAGPKP